MAARGLVAVFVSVTSLDPGTRQDSRAARAAPASPAEDDRSAGEGRRAGRRERLADHSLHQRARDRAHPRGRPSAAGATSAFGIVLRLPWEVNPIFQRWLDQHYPDRAARVMARVREMRGGKDYDSSFGTRMKGEGIWAQLLQQRLARRRSAMASTATAPSSTSPSSESRCPRGATGKPTYSPEGTPKASAPPARREGSEAGRVQSCKPKACAASGRASLQDLFKAMP
jgi:hypothetical protein